MAWDLTRDLVIVGSGAGSMCAAFVAKKLGKSSLILEKQAKVGGSTAYSGGIIWVPMNRWLAGEDSFEKARLYLDNVIGDVGRASTPAIRDAYVRETHRMIAFLEQLGMKFEHARSPDYYSLAPGALKEGRSLICPLFNINELGEWAEHLGRFEAWPPIPIKTSEFANLALAARTWAGRRTAATLMLRLLYQKITGKRLRGMGNAVQGRMLQIALRGGIELWREATMTDLIYENARIAGIAVRREGKIMRVAARAAVLLDSGGFSRADAMRREYQPKPNGAQWTVANPGDTGEVIKAAMGVGGIVDLMDASLWSPSSFQPDGKFYGFHVPNDAGKPHCIVVDAAGRRYANESQGYVDFGHAMYARGAVPSWAILDSRHRKQYPWGMAAPGRTPDDWIRSGYMKKAMGLPELAQACGMEPAVLTATAQRFNGFVANGVDEDFGRGQGAYDRLNSGDPTYQLNPSLGSIEQPPFYAVQLWPADVGTQGGLVVDEFARVVREDGSPIGGLYATGNCTASMVGRSYPGGGASISKALTFAYIAAHHAFGATP
jgi:3-oxosteroid 1-dehydrogenase